MHMVRLVIVVAAWILAPVALAQSLPEGAVARLGVHRFRSRTVFSQGYAVTPDNRTVVTIDRSGEELNRGDVVSYDIVTGLETGRLGIANARMMVMARDQARILLYTGSGFELWDIAKKQRLQSWPRRLVNLDAVVMAISPDGTQFVATVDSWNTLRWNQNSLVLSELFQKHSWRHVFSADGSKFFCYNTHISGTKSRVLVYDTNTNRQIADHTYDDSMVAISPCGRKTARNSGGTRIVVGDLDPSKQPDFVIPGINGKCTFTPDGKHLYLGNYSNTPARLWDMEKNKLVVSYVNFSEYLVFSPDGRSIVTFHTGGERPMRGAGDQLYIWDTMTGKRVRYSSGHSFPVAGMAYAPDGKRLASFCHDTILISDPATGKELRQWIAHEAPITQVVFSHDGNALASAAEDGTIAFWDPGTGKERRRIQAIRDQEKVTKPGVRTIAFTRDGKILTACAYEVLQLWNVEKGELIRSHVFPNARYSQQLSSTGEYAVAGLTFPYGGFVVPFSLASIGRARPPLDSGKSNNVLAFSPNGGLLATANVVPDAAADGTIQKPRHSVRVWECFSRREIMRFDGLPACPMLLAISPDNRILAHSMDASPSQYYEPGVALAFRDLAQAKSESMGQDERDLDERHRWLKAQRLLPLTAHHGPVYHIAFSPDGKHLATGGVDGVIYIWKVAHYYKPPPLSGRQVDLAALWDHLGDRDAGKAHRAVAQMEATPDDTIAFLRKHLLPAKSIDEKTIRLHIRGIHSDSFALRQQSSAALEKVGDDAIPLVRLELATPISLENRRRLEASLDRLEELSESGAKARSHRALMLLQRIGTPTAKGLVEDLARGAPLAWLTEEARCMLAELQRP